MVARDHTLGQLRQLRLRHQFAQLGLAYQDDLQQLLLIGFEVGQQAQLLQHVTRKALRLVDDEHGVLARGMLGEQPGIEGINTFLDGGPRRIARRVRNAEFVADGGQQLLRAELGIEDIRCRAAFRSLLQETATDRGLARPHLAREQYEAATAIEPVEQMRQRLPMALAQKEIARIRGDREGLVLKAEVGGVHGGRIAGDH